MLRLRALRFPKSPRIKHARRSEGKGKLKRLMADRMQGATVQFAHAEPFKWFELFKRFVWIWVTIVVDASFAENECEFSIEPIEPPGRSASRNSGRAGRLF